MTHDNPQQTVLAYLAGIIDGEGCIRIATQTGGANKDKYFGPAINCGMTQAEPIELLHQTFGGSIRWNQPTCKNASPCKPLRYWYKQGRDGVASCLFQLYPYLRAKRQQAAAVLEFCTNAKDKRVLSDDERVVEQRWRQELYDNVKKLNHRGVAATTE